MINLIKIIEKEAYHEFTYCKTQNVISDYMTQEDNTNNVDQLQDMDQILGDEKDQLHNIDIYQCQQMLADVGRC